MKLLVTFSFFLVSYFLYGFYINQYETSTVPRQIHAEHAQNFYDYRGSLNIHTDLSAGSASASFVVTSAKLADLDFIMFTDVNVFDVPTSFESYHGNLLVLNGGKFSYLDSRLIYYSLNQEPVGTNLGDAQVKLADLLSQKTGANKDTLTILAHPYKAGYTLSGEIPSGMDGFEVLNLKSLANRAWQESKLSTIWSLLIYPFNPDLAFLRLFSEPSEEFALFDKMSQQRKIVAYAGTEASARALPLANYLVRFPSYKRSFEFMTTHVTLPSELTGSFNSDRSKIFNALKSGQFYIAMDMLGDPKGFIAMMESDGKNHLMGSEFKLGKNTALKIALPAAPRDFFEIMIYKDGALVKSLNEQPVTYEIKAPGVYRVQVKVIPMLPLPDAKKWIPWIYTNNFYVR
ncbi:hypothetical protein D3C87_1243740 [compost metagenome]